MTHDGLFDNGIVVAPMAGGPTTPDLVVAAASADALAFLAAGYKPASDLERDIRIVRERTSQPFGVNIFVPGRPSPNPAAVTRYVRELEDDATALGAAVGAPRWDDDDWAAKLDVVIEAVPSIVSFAFGCPSREVVSSLRRRGTLVMVTVTDPAEAHAAADAGADAVCAQGFEAGAHRSTFDDTASDRERSTLELVAAVRAAVDLPVVAAGGIATPTDVGATQAAGAIAVQVGTAFLRSPEAGTNPTHRAALADGAPHSTTMTRAFTGRRARGIVNDFIRRHDDDAPSAYPEIHHATRPLRAAAAASGDLERLHLWAGTNYRHAREAPVAEIVAWLAGGRA